LARALDFWDLDIGDKNGKEKKDEKIKERGEFEGGRSPPAKKWKMVTIL